jgi:hypothetical protein
MLAQLAALTQETNAAVGQMAIERSREMERLRGIKIIRLPLITVTGASPLIVTPEQFNVGPDQGWVWSIKLLVIEGLTPGATPDVVNVMRQQRIIWPLNGNQFAQTFGKADQILYPGESIGLQSVGTFAATGKIIVHGAAWQVPAEELGKLM